MHSTVPNADISICVHCACIVYIVIISKHIEHRTKTNQYILIFVHTFNFSLLT